ncbi:MAG: DUF4926 domain-containing protein [Woronichinia naegeliana WA131]|jgi:hypothetical protein|uniref:DUF4926 domain-containing protein n=1 Tax=Woronichinia naegeliana WA131 TaxID=2824559 RepID=A0A977KS00_9CYAN|nr:MAG: DUF4926 domain-containing protein [Woronichinia naegeliana WA131]
MTFAKAGSLQSALNGKSQNKGQAGTVVDISESGVFLVEFSNEKGEMISLESLKREQITLVTSYTQEKTKIMGYQLGCDL